MNRQKWILVLKFALMFLSLIPFITAFPAMYREWCSVPANRYDACYLGIGLVTAAVLIWRRCKEGIAFDRYGLILVIPGASLTCLGWTQNSPDVFSAAGLLFAAGMMWILFGWRFFYRMFPVPLLILLALPTTWYYCLFPGITFHWKLTLASAIVLYTTFALITDFNPIRRRSAFFAAGIIIYAIVYAAL